ncbi:AAA family ATPase [Ferruginibacter sp. SUN106]|uniref:AAA family ATPase n=1 Tax=Ferruginibacter sp. SUN106 TaxID=2978348 RepID=UPI003D36AE1D
MWTLTTNKNWEQLKKLSWVNDMHGVPQSPVYHAEGDVAIHTQMVLAALENMEEFKALQEQEQEIVWAAALMHDIEKRSTTITDENGNIVSPGHAKKGAITTRQILYRDFVVPFDIREQVVGLVRYHGLPLWVFEKPNPVQALLKASLEVNIGCLAMLAKADVLGRICSDANELLYKIELFKELAVEYDCGDKPKQFASNLSKFQYFRKDDRHPDFEAFDDTKTNVIIMSGIAGSGKDFHILKNYPLLPVISLDDMRRKLKINYGDTKGNGHVIQAAKEQAKEYLRKAIPFVWNATNITLQMREQLIDLIEPYKPTIKIVYVETGYAKLIAQNKNRDFAIPLHAIEKMIDKLEVPKLWEAMEVEYVIH